MYAQNNWNLHHETYNISVQIHEKLKYINYNIFSFNDKPLATKLLTNNVSQNVSSKKSA